MSGKRSISEGRCALETPFIDHIVWQTEKLEEGSMGFLSHLPRGFGEIAALILAAPVSGNGEEGNAPPAPMPWQRQDVAFCRFLLNTLARTHFPTTDELRAGGRAAPLPRFISLQQTQASFTLDGGLVLNLNLLNTGSALTRSVVLGSLSALSRVGLYQDVERILQGFADNIQEIRQTLDPIGGCPVGGDDNLPAAFKPASKNFPHLDGATVGFMPYAGLSGDPLDAYFVKVLVFSPSLFLDYGEYIDGAAEKKVPSADAPYAFEPRLWEPLFLNVGKQADTEQTRAHLELRPLDRRSDDRLLQMLKQTSIVAAEAPNNSRTGDIQSQFDEWVRTYRHRFISVERRLEIDALRRNARWGAVRAEQK